jgi:hypothetical protein
MGFQVYPDLATVSDVLSGDLLLLTRPSLGAAGSKAIDARDFLKAVAALIAANTYIIPGSMTATQPGNAIIAHHIPPVPILIPAASNPTVAHALITATGATTLSVRKNGTQFATINFSAGVALGSFTIGSDTSFNGVSDYLTVLNPATPDATLAICTWSIYGTRIY